MKLSIIIPVYRVEATLDRCIESVLHQDIDDFEVILIDDGSPDNCPKMCDEWALRDAHIRVIHQPNGGLSAARNAGIDAAQGEYITFVDSDDYISPDTYAPLLEDIGTADIIEYPVYKRLSLQDKEYSNIDRYWLETKAYAHTYACNKIYRSSLFADVRFPVGRVFEDAYTFPLLLRRAHSIITTSKGCYHYDENPQGITATADGTKLSMLLDAHMHNGMPMDDEYYLHLLNIQMDVWEQTSQPIVLPTRRLHTDIFNGKNKLKALALNTLGTRTLCRINKLIHHFVSPSR